MIFLPVLAVLAACWHSFVALHRQWTDWDNLGQTHGYLVAAICLVLLWRERRNIAAAATAVKLRNAIPLALLMAPWLFAVMAGIQSVELLLPVPLLLCAMGAGLGWTAARRAAFPIGYFLFAMPVWAAFNGIFQWSSVYAVRAALRLVGVPAFFDANRVQIPEGTFEVADGCSGLHFVVVGLAIAALLGQLRRDRVLRRVQLLLLALMLAMFANWVRVFIIIMAGHLTHMQNYLVARSHYGFGWMVFAVFMAIFFVIERHLPEQPDEKVSVPAAPPHAVVHWSAVALAVVPLLALFAVWHALAARPAAGKLELPSAPATWSVAGAGTDRWRPVLIGADEAGQLSYRRIDGASIDVHVALYRWQAQGKEFAAYWNDLLPGATLLGSHVDDIDGWPFVVRRFHAAGGDEYLIAATYQVGARSFANADYAQLWYAARALLQLRSPLSEVVLLRAACRPDCAAAMSVLRDWRGAS